MGPMDPQHQLRIKRLSWMFYNIYDKRKFAVYRFGLYWTLFKKIVYYNKQCEVMHYWTL